MKRANQDLDRLLNSAAGAPEEAPVQAPFGFETRVVALWRAAGPKKNGLAGLLRGIALSSAAIIVLAAAGTVLEYQQSADAGDASTNEYAIADSAIQMEFSQ